MVSPYTDEALYGRRPLSLNDLDWVYTGGGGRLHKAVLTREQDAELNDYAAVIAPLLCGLSPRWVHIPGFFSRLGMPRCVRCCARAGLPRGVGSPKNDPECRRVLGLEDKEVK